jgi:amino acid transporter
MFAMFTLMGGDIAIVAAGEAASPRKDLPQVVRFMYLAPIGCYVLAAFLVGFNINYTEPDLFHPWANSRHNPDVSHSPFIIVLKYTSIKVLPTFINGCFVFSAYTAALVPLSPTKSCLVSTKTNGLLIGIPVFILLVELCSPLLRFMVTISLTKPLAERIMEIHLWLLSSSARYSACSPFLVSQMNLSIKFATISI